MGADAENKMDGAERVEWLDHVTEWAQELADEAGDYALDCSYNAGNLLPLEDEFEAVAALARDLRARLGHALAAARAEAGA